MGTKNISLPLELEQFVEAKVASGEFAHYSEVVREGLRLMMRQEAEKLAWLRDAIADGLLAAQTQPLVQLTDSEMEKLFSRGRAKAAIKKRLGT